MNGMILIRMECSERKLPETNRVHVRDCSAIHSIRSIVTPVRPQRLRGLNPTVLNTEYCNQLL